jgi:hypothetical protein
MTDDQLDAVEAALGVELPAEYRRVSREFPFRPLGRDAVYWFFNDPAAVIAATRTPLGGEYPGAPLLPRYVAIGHSPAGDVYLLDLDAPGHSVVVLSHETHAVEPEWPTFAAFVTEWVRAPTDLEEERGAVRAVAWLRQDGVAAGVITLVVVLLAVGVAVVAGRR